MGSGMEQLLANQNIHLVETDVGFGPRTQVICDACNLPFADRSFDGVVIQAVLQYVVDPDRFVTRLRGFVDHCTDRATSTRGYPPVKSWADPSLYSWPEGAPAGRLMNACRPPPPVRPP